MTLAHLLEGDLARPLARKASTDVKKVEVKADVFGHLEHRVGRHNGPGEGSRIVAPTAHVEAVNSHKTNVTIAVMSEMNA